MIRKFALGFVSAIALTASAHAADIYKGEGGYKDGPVYAPVSSWTGFYAGVNGGYAFAENEDQFRNTIHSNFRGLEVEGGFGGGQIGYNFGGLGFGPRFVIGVEADFQGSDISDKAGFANGNVSYESNVNYFGTVRGRVGYAFDRTLVYATGGFAYGEVESRINDLNGPVGGNVFRAKETETGYVVGGGLEHKFNPSWSLKAEYQYISLDTTNPKNAGGFTYSNNPNHLSPVKVDDTALHTVRVGLNYHINKEYEPLK